LQDCPTPSLSLSSLSTPNRRRAAAQEEPHDPTCQPPRPLHRRRLCACPWRPRLRRQASRCCLAINAHWPPSTPPNRRQPLRPAIGPTAALTRIVSSTRSGCRERAPRSRSCTCPLPSCRTPFYMASSVHSRSTHAQNFYPSTWPARGRNRAHLD
jgi:hypothetical protein